MQNLLKNYEDVVKYYNEMWDKSKNILSLEAERIRHLCRKIIIRAVLDYMQNIQDETDKRGFFDRLMSRCDDTLPSKDVIAKSSYARRILTYLDNMNTENNGEPVSFPELVENLLSKPIRKSPEGVSINDSRIDDIAEILTMASQTARIHTNGVKLVTINVDSSFFTKKSLSETKKNLAQIIKSQWNRYRFYMEGKQDETVNDKIFNIKITCAGSVLAMLFPCFEYFACRYQTNSIPLFMLKSESDRRKLLFGMDKSEKNNIGIYHRAMNCIDSVLKYETSFLSMGRKNSSAEVKYGKPKWLFDYDKDGIGMVHPLRIICDHIGYLRDYRSFLADIDDNSYDNEHYKNNDGQGVMDEAIEKYRQKYVQIMSDYESYLKLGNIPNYFL